MRRLHVRGRDAYQGDGSVLPTLRLNLWDG